MTNNTFSPLPGGDDRPWYRQFWPWFLILLPASVVVASFVTLFIANRHADDLVVDEYYKNGLAINQQLEKKQRAETLGVTADIAIDGLSVVVQMQGPVTAQQLHLLLSHPLEADRDFSLTLADFGSSIYRGTLTQPAARGWHWILEHRDEPVWRLDGTLDDADLGDATL